VTLVEGAPGLFDLSGKCAIVTGSTRGIGRAIAEAFAGAGARVMLSSEDATACAEVEQDMIRAGYGVRSCKCDVTVIEDQRALVDATLSAFGGLDIVVANAGIAGPAVHTTDASPGDYDRVMATNLTSAVRLCGLVLPHLKARGGGSIILMSSISAIRGNKAIGPYALAKAGLAQLARNLAVEHGPDNIRANAIAPGLIRTDLSRVLLENEAFAKRRMAMTPLRRPGETEEIAGMALFLASRAGGFITGQTLIVDGGTTITDGN
jgi:NAD(P)-dependent dehydrogenase (short-subunit alcohol dehydrogenase family)